MTFVLDNYDSVRKPVGEPPRQVCTGTGTSSPSLAPRAGRFPHGLMVRIASRFTPSFSCWEGKPLPAPLPRGATRRERLHDDSR